MRSGCQRAAVLPSRWLFRRGFPLDLGLETRIAVALAVLVGSVIIRERGSRVSRFGQCEHALGLCGGYLAFGEHIEYSSAIVGCSCHRVSLSIASCAVISPLSSWARMSD